MKTGAILEHFSSSLHAAHEKIERLAVCKSIERLAVCKSIYFILPYIPPAT